MGKKVKIKVDKPIGSVHHRFKQINYTSNYGYLEGVIAPDGDFIDAYVLKVDKPVNEYEGIVVAIVHRTQDDDDKLVVTPEGEKITDEEIEKAIELQEKWSESKHVIIRQILS